MHDLQTQIKTDDSYVPIEDLYEEAKALFSEGLIEHLKAKGLDVIEGQSEGIYINDINGTRFIDCYCAASTYNLGRKNKTVVDSLKSAAKETDCGNFILVSEEKAELSSKLARFVAGDLSCVLFTVVRGEAMDAACKLARGYTGKTELISVDGGWYGHTGFAMGLSEHIDKDRYGRLIPDQTIVEFNNIAAAKKAINKNTAAFILEPVQVENGCRLVDKDYLLELKAVCEHYGALLIFDETQTGFGRTGHKFAKDYYDVNPDILLFGEAITTGLFPMTGMVFTPTVKSFFDIHPLIHLCTFGGHDVGCRVACKTLDVYEQMRPWIQTNETGAVLLNHLSRIQSFYPDLIRSVSGLGLVNAITFTKEELAQLFCVTARNNGFIVVQGLVAKESVVFRPPLTITRDELNRLMELISSTMKSVNNQRL
ncbi:MAG: aspartate aminotransferase family protein [Desulfobacterales bacterium]|nr:aspartate aminotransferase family protein [Desulfobacterales bacterium]